MEVKVLKDILNVNDQLADRNRQLLEGHKVFAINIMSSPGAGKTSLILETIKRLKDKLKIGVVEGDVSSSIDADKISQEKVPVIQINTGGGCHLDANMTSSALNSLPLGEVQLLFIENVGNLICPSQFQLGEHKRVVLASVPEGDDKPYKYPAMFQIADVVLINKIDLLPYLKFDIKGFSRAVKTLNQNADILQISCTTGEGIENWITWVLANVHPSAP